MKFTTTAVLDKSGKYYHHFHITELSASLYGDKPEDIVTVELKISDNQDKPEKNANVLNTDYWGWFDEPRQEFTMIYPQYFLLNMCFPYGIKAEEDRKYGKAYRLEVVSTQ